MGLSPQEIKQLSYGFLIFEIITITRGFVINPIIYLISDREIMSVLLMVSNTFLTSIIFILIYDYIKKDFLLIELYKKNVEEKKEQVLLNSTTRRIAKFNGVGNSFLVFALIIWDPSLTIVYLRKGSYKWNNIPGKMILLLFGSSLACNIIGLILLEILKKIF